MARFLACGDSALTVELGQGISPEINARVTALTALITAWCARACSGVLFSDRAV